MANNIPQLKADFRAALNNNLDATTRTKVLNRFIAEHQAEWDALVAGGTADTVLNRANFAVEKMFSYMRGIFQAGSRRENLAAQPPTDREECLSRLKM